MGKKHNIFRFFALFNIKKEDILANLLKIEHDPFFIAQRLKEIDPTYQIYFNLDQGCYEVHSSGQVKNTYCFKVPYGVLDERTISFALKTRVENMEAILREIDRQNDLLYNKMLKEQINLFEEKLCE